MTHATDVMRATDRFTVPYRRRLPRSPTRTPAEPRSGGWLLVIAAAVPTVLAAVDVVAEVRLTQLLVVGVCLAAMSGRTRWVAAIAVYVIALMSVLAIPNQTWGRPQQMYTTAGGIGVGAVCVALAAHRNRLEGSMRATERRRSVLAAIVESADEAIVGCDLDGTISTWNTAAELLFGYRADEAVGRSVRLIYAPELSAELTESAVRVARGESFLRPETTGVHRDGRLLTVALLVSPIRDDTGRVTGASAFVHDIAPAKAAAAEHRALEEQLHQFQRVESLGQLAGGIAHDFNNLLAVIMTSTEFLLDECDDPAAVRTDAQQIRMAADRGAQLTRQLLLFARGEQVPPETVDLDTVIGGLRSLLQRIAGPEVELQTRTGDHRPAPGTGTGPAAGDLTDGDPADGAADGGGVPAWVHADVSRLEQVLLNLVVNARDAMAGSGHLVVATDIVQLRPGQPGLNPPPNGGPHVLLSVGDNGAGMTPDVAARVFEPFFTTKANGTGTGLGLATVWGIVTEARGSMAVDTELGVGTTFRVYLPLAAAPEPSPVAVPPAVEAPAARVLVVDDEKQIRDLVAEILRRAGHEVLVAASGPAALDLAAGQPLDLLVTDVVMPAMSGQRLAELLGERQPEAAVVLMSGQTGEVVDTRTDRGTRGARRPIPSRGVLEKPFTERQLLDEVRLALAGRPAEQTAGGRGPPAALTSG